MKYRLLLGGVRIDGVIDVKESVKRDIKQYISINGNAFCQDRGKTLRFWQVEIELCLYDKDDVDRLLENIKLIGEKGEPLLLSVSSDMGSFSARVLMQDIETEFVNSEACRVTLGLLEYLKPEVSTADSNRPGTAPEPPSLITADEVFKITTQYSRIGKDIAVKNPLTGADIENIAAIDGNTIVKIEKTG